MIVKEWARHCPCPKGCNNDNMYYSSKWDRFFCMKCDVWLENGCDCGPESNTPDKIECHFECWKCPAKPSESKE